MKWNTCEEYDSFMTSYIYIWYTGGFIWHTGGSTKNVLYLVQFKYTFTVCTYFNKIYFAEILKYGNPCFRYYSSSLLHNPSSEPNVLLK